MPVNTTCAKCNWTISVADRNIGKRGRCPKCRAPIYIRKPWSLKFWADSSGKPNYRRLYWIGLVVAVASLALGLFISESKLEAEAGSVLKTVFPISLLLSIGGFCFATMCGALRKGRSPWWGVFGLLSFWGLLVPAWIDDKSELERRRNRKSRKRAAKASARRTPKKKPPISDVEEIDTTSEDDLFDGRCPNCLKKRAVRIKAYMHERNQFHEQTMEQSQYHCIHCSPIACMAADCESRATKVIRHRMPAGPAYLPLFDVVNPRNDCWVCKAHSGFNSTASLVEWLGRAAFLATIVLLIMWQAKDSVGHAWAAAACIALYLIACACSNVIRGSVTKKRKYATRLKGSFAGVARTHVDDRF